MSFRESIRRIWPGSDDKRAASTIQVAALLGNTYPDRQLQIILDEIADLTKAMREFLMTVDRYVYFGGLIAAGALTLGIIHNKGGGLDWIALVFAPYAIGLSFIYIIQVFTEIERRAGYRKFLESKAREHLRAPVFLYSDISSWNERNRPSTWGAMFINSVGLLIFAFLGVEQTGRYEARGPSTLGINILNLHYLNIAGLAILGLILGAAMLENLRESNRAYEVAQEVWEKYSKVFASHMKKLTINLVSESAFSLGGHGVDTAFREDLKLLKGFHPAEGSEK